MHTPVWLQLDRPQFPSLDRDLSVDVVVIGGGITGVTAAYLLKQEGHTVALVEKEFCGGGDTGHTTAHLTYVTDCRLSRLVKDLGEERARAAWYAGWAAILQIHANVSAESLDCDFAWVPGFLHAAWDGSEDERQSLGEDARLAAEFGFDSAYVERIPVANRPGVRFSNQARFHPYKYLTGLLKKIDGAGSYVFEDTHVEEVVDDPLSIRCGTNRIRCNYVVMATHAPLPGKTGLLRSTALQTKLAAYTTYVLGARLPAGSQPSALLWDTSEPYYYLRIEPREGFDYAIFGGEDHKAGQAQDTEARFSRLEGMLGTILPQATVVDRWSGEVIETIDGLPFMGETSERQFVATGYSGNGMTFGTLAGMMARDAAIGRRGPWADLFDVGRTAVKAGAWDYVKENLDFPYYFVKDRLTRTEKNAPESVPAGEGRILKVDGERVAVYRDEHGAVTQLSPVCTHMGCIVHWNEAEKTWDCPCHGSRFHPTGEVLAGPATSRLEEHAHVEAAGS
jgi:glycine/D-amino acid oxidase-like deaminating enzyme/nitrite reductase/ring-hydroxylating ferredoxin subunit